MLVAETGVLGSNQPGDKILNLGRLLHRIRTLIDFTRGVRVYSMYLEPWNGPRDPLRNGSLIDQ